MLISPATCLVIYNRNDCWGRYEYNAFCRGLQEESDEHPGFSLDEVAEIVMDHLDKSPSAYADERPGWTRAGYTENPDDGPSRRRRYGNVDGKPWTRAEREALREMSETMSVAEAASHLGRSEYSVHSKAKKLGLDFGERFISAAEVARNIGASKTSVSAWAKKLGLTKTRSTGKGRKTPLELEDVIKLLDALLAGRVGASGRGTSASVSRIKSYRDKLMGDAPYEPEYEQIVTRGYMRPPPRKNPALAEKPVSYGGRVGSIPYLIVSCCAHDMALAWAIRWQDDLVDPSFLDDLERDFMNVWADLGREMADRINHGLDPAPRGVFAAVMTQVDHDGRNVHFNDRLSAYLASKVGNLIAIGIDGTRNDIKNACVNQSWLWLRDQLVDPSVMDLTVTTLTGSGNSHPFLPHDHYRYIDVLSRVSDSIALLMQRGGW